jgi:hypothetical protein
MIFDRFITELINNQQAAQARATEEKSRHRVIQEVYADSETIVVDFHTREKVSIESGEFCTWYNDIRSEDLFFKPIKPEDLDAWNVDFEMIELYCHWQLGLWGVCNRDDDE